MNKYHRINKCIFSVELLLYSSFNSYKEQFPRKQDFHRVDLEFAKEGVVPKPKY